MSWRKRLPARPAPTGIAGRGDLAAQLLAGAAAPARGALSSIFARLRGREAATTDTDDPWPPADEATVRALREDLAGELVRVSREHASR